MKNIKIKYIILGIIGIFLIWFLFLRTTELIITYDGIEQTSNSFVVPEMTMSYKSMGTGNTTLSVSNMLDSSSVYEEAIEGYAVPERYRENLYYKVDTEEFDKLISTLNLIIKEYNGIVKINEQNSNRRKEYDKEFYPKYQVIEFTINNNIEDLSKIEKVLKDYGNIRSSNTSKTSIEQEIENNKNKLKEIEAARKALQNSKDKDWIARQDSNYAKESEKIKNQIENAEKQSTYKTYTIDIYEVIKFKVNSIKYWYENNYELKNAISNSLPDMIKLFVKLIPITLMLLIFICICKVIIKSDKEKQFKNKLDMIENIKSNKDIHFDIKF